MAGKKKVAAKCLDAHGKFLGYQFAEDDIANQMAYLFAGDEGEKEAARILQDAEQFGPLELSERREFIQEAIKKKATEVDNQFQSGLSDIFNTLKNKNHPCSGDEAGKEAVFNLMKGLGLNVDKDSLQTQYDPGPPQMLMITWVNRPTENLANKDSNVNKLADAYAKTFRPDASERQEFEKSMGDHRNNALNGGPKVDKAEFLRESKQAFEDFKNQQALEADNRLGM